MATIIAANDPRLRWEGAVSIQQDPSGWVMPWRLPHNDLCFHPCDVLVRCAKMPAGVRLAFTTDTESITCHVEPLIEDGNIDLCIGSEYLMTVAFKEGDTAVTFTGLPRGEKTVHIWLPVRVPFQLQRVTLSEGASLEAYADHRPRWVTYGSSITHGTTAGSPAFTWPSIVSRKMGLNLTSLGFGGQCHADPMIARIIRDLPADVVSVNLGINIQGHNSLNERSFLPAVFGIIATIRDGHPTTPFVMGSSIVCPPKETTPNAVGMTLVKMRENIQQAVEVFRQRGDENLFYLDGLAFSPGAENLLPDECHPTPDGYKIMAENFIEQVFRQIGVQIPRVLVPSV